MRFPKFFLGEVVDEIFDRASVRLGRRPQRIAKILAQPPFRYGAAALQHYELVVCKLSESKAVRAFM